MRKKTGFAPAYTLCRFCGVAIALLFIVLSTSSLTAQSLQSLVPVVPTSPQADAFQKYGEYAVNFSTGVPDISIPLYEIDHRGYKIPLALKYFPQALKPGYNYDVYGHGWGLSVNSAVSRSIEGNPDEWSNFNLEEDKFDYYYFIDPVAAWYCTTIPSCNLETLPRNNPNDYNFFRDKFNVVLPDGSSFDFIIHNENNQGRQFAVSEGRQVKIAGYFSNNNISSFTIIDEAGVKYTFEGSDTPYHGSLTSYPQTYVSWQLTRIDLPYSTEPVIFSYGHSIQTQYDLTCEEPGIFISDFRHSDGEDLLRGVLAQNVPGYPSYYYKMKLLSSISYGNTVIRLSYKDQSQTSGYAGPPYNYVTGIRVLENASLIRDIKLDMTIKDVAGYCIPYKLAKLDSVSIRGADSTAVPLRYRCAYNLSNYMFYGTDHWGYLNDFNTRYDVANFNVYVGFNLSEFPGVLNDARISAVTKPPQDLCPYSKIKLSKFNFNNRQPGTAESHGVLSRLSYPTGGRTDFEFENHRFLTSSDHNGDYISELQNRVTTNAAGFRIKKITNYAKDGMVAEIKNYRYGKTNIEAYPPNHVYAMQEPYFHTGTGEPVADPNVLTYMNYAFVLPNLYPRIFTKYMVLGLDINGQDTAFLNPFNTDLSFHQHAWRWACTFSATNFRRLVNGRPPVLYADVTVYYGEIDEHYQYSPGKTAGKTVYKYDLTKHGLDLLGRGRDGIFIEAPYYIDNVLSYTAQRYSYNKLKEKIDFKVDGQGYKPVKKENNSWYTLVNDFTDYLYVNAYPIQLTPFSLKLHSLFAPKPNPLGVSLLQSRSTTYYSPGGDSAVSAEDLSYNTRNQVSLTRYRTSANKMVEKTYSYPGETTGIIMQKMVAKNMISPVIQSTTKVGDLHQPLVEIAGSKNEYNEYNIDSSAIIRPARSYELEIKPSGAEYVLRNEIENYSANGNPVDFLSRDGIHSAYIWGYNDRYMVAEAKNAEATQIACSSFEDDTKGNWTYNGTVASPPAATFVPTGKKYYNLTPAGELSKAVTSGNTYIISYWTNGAGAYTINGGTGTVTTERTAGGWTCFKHVVTAGGATLSISGTGGIDEVRLYPADAQLTTYTFDPPVGMTSRCDLNNRIVYYRYDDYGRLQFVKDDAGNILKTIEYHYQQ
jgi:hypothetical protein